MTSASLESARTQFAEVGLVFPPVPQELVTEFRSFGPWTWGTRKLDPMKMYLFQHFGDAKAKQRVPRDYVALCHAGHGVNSFALTYHLVYKPIAIIFQVPWGAIYADPTIDARLFADHCEWSAGLVDLATRVRNSGVNVKGVGLVECSEFRKIATFQILNGGGGGDPSRTLGKGTGNEAMRSETVYAQAHDWLASLLIALD